MFCAVEEKCSMTVRSNNKAFEDAFSRFLETLSKEDRQKYSPCASSQDLLDGLRKLDFISKKGQNHRGTRVLKAIKSFSDRLQPYFDVVSIFIQADPSKAAFVWGSIRLVLQLASNYVTFFDKLIQNIERLTDAFPQYEQIARLCNYHGLATATMTKHLEELYVDLLQFLQAVARVFTNKKGKLKRTSTAIGVLFWNPFDLFFEELLTRMTHHRQLLSLDVQLFQAESIESIEVEAVKERKFAAEERERARIRAKDTSSDSQWVKEELLREQKERTSYRISKWLAAPQFAETLHKAHIGRQEGTNCWILEDENFRNWMKGVNESPQITPKKRKFDSNVFWIHGNPGSGKTVLASFIVEELQSIAQDDQTPLFYFFFRQAQPTENHRAAAYRSLLSQILNAFRHDEEILDIFAFAYETSPSGQIIATPAEMFELLQLCMIKLAGSTFLLDGLDECSDNDSLLTELLLLQVNILSNCKFVLLSRRNLLCLSKMVANDRQKEMERSLVSKDIARYLKHQLETLFEDDMLPKSAHIPSLAENMVQGADGMFLWAHLMISYLRSPVFTPSRRVRTIKDIVMPEGLEAMYERIICLIQCHNRLERDLASQVFIWLTHAKKRLDTPQLRSVIFEDAEDFDAQERQATDLIETVSFVCEGLVESRTVGAETYVDFIHLSVREYFTQIGGDAFSSTQCRNSLIPPKEIAHLYLAKKCFCELVQKSEIEAGLPRPFTAYAVEFVIFHLSETKGFLSTPSFSIKMEWQKNAEAVIQACHKFLGTPAAISNWIEKTYSHSMLMSDNIHSPLELDGLAAWVEWVDPNLIHFPSPEKAKRLVCDLKAFIADMQNVIYHWDTKLKSDPSLIWDEVSAFSQSQFLQSSTASSASSLISKQPENISASSRSLCTISETSPDCTRTAILSIWPSSAFEQSWGKLESGGSLSSMLHLCSGWTATYEIWIKSKRKNRYQISLEEKEISLLMRQSFREEFTDEWKTSFPLAISPSLVSFIVLRTMFTVEATWCKSTEIDMSFQEANHHYWDADLQPFESQDETIIGLPPFLRHLHHDWYSYRFTFSSDEKYVLLSQFVYHSKKKDLVVLRSLPSGKMQYVSRLNVSTRFGHEHRLLSVFHPRDDLLIFFACDALHFWEFGQGNSRQVTTVDNQHGFDKPRDILLSSCGKYVLLPMDTPSNTRTQSQVIPIPDHLLSSESNSGCSVQEAVDTSLSRIGCTDVSEFNFQPGHVIGHRHFHLGTNGSTMQTTSGSSLQIELERREDQENSISQSLKVIEFPGIGSSEDYDSVIQLPLDGSSRVQIHMNRKVQRGYDLRQNTFDLAPFVSSRDARFMRLQTTYVKGAITPAAEDGGWESKGVTGLSDYRLFSSEPLEAKRPFEDIDRTMTKRLRRFEGTI